MSSYSSKKIFIPGTGNAQFDFIKLCKKYGLEVHSCSYKDEGRGIGESDFFSLINIKDIPRILEYVENNGIDIVYAIGSDIAIQSAATVSETLNLPALIDSETARICTHKSRVREKLRSHPEYSVNFKEINDKSDLNSWNHYPAVVKPSDNQGQRGISKIFDFDQLIHAYTYAAEHSETKTAIVEEFIKGLEISINLYVVDGVIRFRFISERLSFEEYPGGIVKSHRYPANGYIDLNKIDRMTEVLVDTLGIQNGPVYMQVIIAEDGSPKVIEVTPRMDGCHLWRLIVEVTGINLLEILLNHITRGIVEPGVFEKKPGNKNNHVELFFFTGNPNSQFLRSNYQVSESAVFVDFFYKDGQKIRETNGYEEKAGYQIVV